MNGFPLFSFLFLRIVFISWYSLFINKLTITLFRDWINQIPVGIRSSPIAFRDVFNRRLFVSLVGSNIENIPSIPD